MRSGHEVRRVTTDHQTCETSVDAANVLSLLVSEDAGLITADPARGRRLQSKRGIGFKSLWTRRVRTAGELSRLMNAGTFQALL
jgi:hypothetical protein